MKKMLVAMLLIGATFSSLIAQTEWELIFHSTSIPTLEKEMGEMLAAGYEPVGIELVRDGVKKGVLTMYEKVEDQSIQSMKIVEIFDFNTIKETITKEAKNGYLPLDLTYYTQSIIVLFVKYEDSPITEWAFDAAEASYADIGKSLEKFSNKSREWIPVGIMGHEIFKKYLLMYLKVPGLELQDYNVYTFEGLENFQQGIDQLYSEGWSICGFSIYGNEWDVVVVKVDINENYIDKAQSNACWTGNWEGSMSFEGEGFLTVQNVTDESFYFKLEAVNSRGNMGMIEKGIAFFNPDAPTLAVFYDENYPNYSIVFSMIDNNIWINEIDPNTRTQNLNSPYCGAGVNFTGTYYSK
ncbi:MAG: hypothetical protein JXR69_09510 [Candidatus Delongbacteria bacterium]|nr:hypothetical protein [Candidatus Delongbacteria bacterium]